jgi:protein gp37
MSDLFHERVPADYIGAVGEVMRSAEWHVFQILTKRAARMQSLLSRELHWMGDLPHVWYGVSVENRRYGLPRLRSLQRTPAQVKFLSIEPLLEDLGELDLGGIDWVIVGGESGYGARPMQEQWVSSLQHQCSQQGVPFFFKQWGGRRKSTTGRELHGRTYDEFPLTLATRAAG